jgi:hypothetical protein
MAQRSSSDIESANEGIGVPSRPVVIVRINIGHEAPAFSWPRVKSVGRMGPLEIIPQRVGRRAVAAPALPVALGALGLDVERLAAGHERRPSASAAAAGESRARPRRPSTASTSS